MHLYSNFVFVAKLNGSSVDSVKIDKIHYGKCVLIWTIKGDSFGGVNNLYLSLSIRELLYYSIL